MALFSPGLRLAERYRLESSIGVSELSTAWRAHDELLDRAVVVKTLSSSATVAAVAAGSTAVANEARAVASITHPNVVAVYDFGEVDTDGVTVPYLVLEFVEGESLTERLRRGALPAAQALAIGADVASALSAAHEQSVVHGDLRPTHVFVTSTGVKVAGFGLAPSAGPDRAGPEADVYQLGLLLQTMITPAESPTSELTVQLRAVTQRCLAAPGDRPEVTEVARSLASLVTRARSRSVPHYPAGVAAVPAVATMGSAADRTWVQPLTGSPDAPEHQPGARVRRRRSPLVAVAVVVLLLGVILLGAAALTQSGSGGPNPLVNSGPEAPAKSPEGPGSQPTTDATAPDPTPTADDPNTREAVLTGIEVEIARALDAGHIGADTAKDLADDVRSLRNRLDRGRGDDLIERTEDIRHRLAEQVSDGELDAGVAARVDGLLAVLLRLRD